MVNPKLVPGVIGLVVRAPPYELSGITKDQVAEFRVGFSTTTTFKLLTKILNV
jgi:hypothetical protein